MGQFRKRPIVIEAFKLGADPWPDWALDARSANTITTHNTDGRLRGGPDYATINTLEGKMVASCGDYIIKGIAGEIYSCKPDVFTRTYEAA